MASFQSTRKLSQACLHLYGPGLSLGTFASRAYAFLRELVPTEFIAFGTLGLKTKQLDIGLDNAVPGWDQAMEAYGRLMPKYELFNWNPRVNQGRPFCRSDFFSDRQFLETDMYAEVYRVAGVDNHCAVPLLGVDDEISFFGLERKGGPDFSREERELLILAQPHLGNARKLVKMRGVMEQPRRPDPEVLARSGLTPREADVLSWMAEGKSNEEIAILLGLGFYTVKDYVKGVFQKTGAPNRLSAALWALRYCAQQGRACPGVVPPARRVPTTLSW